jgi:hypothetical protein
VFHVLGTSFRRALLVYAILVALTPAPVSGRGQDVKESWVWMATVLWSSGYAADLSPASLWEIDRFFDEQSRGGKARPGGMLSKELGPKLFAIGAYVGEVIRRARGGRWVADPRAENNVSVHLADGSVIWPVQQTMRRFKNGPEEGIAAYGQAQGVDVGPKPNRPR